MVLPGKHILGDVGAEMKYLCFHVHFALLPRHSQMISTKAKPPHARLMNELNAVRWL